MLFDKSDQLIEALGRLQVHNEEPEKGVAAGEIHGIYKVFKDEVRANISGKECLPESLIYLSRLSHTYQELGKQITGQLAGISINDSGAREKKTSRRDKPSAARNRIDQ
jgi:septation ring formation regulator EzrA